MSVLIPNRNSPYAARTIMDILEKAAGDIEVIVHVDEVFPEPAIRDSRVLYLTHAGPPRGLRAGINAAAKAASGEYVMKLDDHCLLAKGFDVTLIRHHAEDNWVTIPRRYSLDAENWKINRGRPHRDYLYLCYPQIGKKHDDGIHGVEWWERQEARAVGHDIDDTPSMQGSAWFCTKHHLLNRLGGMQELGYGQFAQEAQEIGLKTWLGGGRVVVNKLTYYAHLHKGKAGRGYHFSDRANVAGINWSALHWINDEEPGMAHPFAWFVDEKFPGMPTWPADWKAQLTATGQLKARANA